MDDRIVYRGGSRTIEWAVMPDGKMPGERDWRKLDKASQAKLFTTIKRLGDHGEYRNEERFSHERNKIWAMKAFKVRAYCFMTQDARIVLTNAAEMKRQNARLADPDKAARKRREYINEQLYETEQDHEDAL